MIIAFVSKAQGYLDKTRKCIQFFHKYFLYFRYTQTVIKTTVNIACFILCSLNLLILDNSSTPSKLFLETITAPCCASIYDGYGRTLAF